MNQGRELDAAVAKVIGCDVGTRVIDMRGPDVWVRSGDEAPVKQPPETRTLYYCQCVPYHIHNGDNGQIPEYSSDILAAWEVVEKMREIECPEDRHAGFTIWQYHEGGYVAGWSWHEAEYCTARAETAPHAICLAALKAVGVIP